MAVEGSPHADVSSVLLLAQLTTLPAAACDFIYDSAVINVNNGVGYQNYYLTYYYYYLFLFHFLMSMESSRFRPTTP